MGHYISGHCATHGEIDMDDSLAYCEDCYETIGKDELAALRAEIAELRADLEWYAAHRCIGYKDRISFSVKPYSTFCLRKEVEHDGTTADLLRVIRAARKGEI